MGAVGAVGGITGTVSATEHVDPRKLNELRQATAKYHDLEKALEDGYFLPADHCVPGMGYHYVKPETNDPTAPVDGSVSHTDPEVLVYEERDGERHLVAVEFLAISEEPPTLLGQEMHHFEEPIADWALHVWAWKHNPNGLFADTNPRVDCPE